MYSTCKTKKKTKNKTKVYSHLVATDQDGQKNHSRNIPISAAVLLGSGFYMLTCMSKRECTKGVLI